MKKIILASTSERRQTLLKQIGIKFEVIESNINEDVCLNCSPCENVKTLAYRKAKKISDTINQPAVIIGADTMVFFNDELLGKPKNESEAIKTLKKLQNNKHTVYTGVGVIVKHENGYNQEYTLFDSTDVYMRKLNDKEILEYINTKEYIDKAGSYGIQGKGIVLIEKINGDYNTVVGLPLTKLYILLKNIGISW